MGVSVDANNMTVVHADSGGVTASFPDVCKTPSPGGPMPVPYPNVAKSSDSCKTAKKVFADGNKICIETSHFSKSNGDEAGSLGGVVSNKHRGKAEFINSSFNVKAEGKGVPRAFDLMLHNDKNTPPTPLLQGPSVAINEDDEVVCIICEKKL